MHPHPRTLLAHLNRLGLNGKVDLTIVLICTLIVAGSAFRQVHSEWMFALLTLSWASFLLPFRLAVWMMWIAILVPIILWIYPGYLLEVEDFGMSAAVLIFMVIPPSMMNLRRSIRDAKPTTDPQT